MSSDEFDSSSLARDALNVEELMQYVARCKAEEPNNEEKEAHIDQKVERKLSRFFHMRKKFAEHQECTETDSTVAPLGQDEPIPTTSNNSSEIPNTETDPTVAPLRQDEMQDERQDVPLPTTSNGSSKTYRESFWEKLKSVKNWFSKSKRHDIPDVIDIKDLGTVENDKISSVPLEQEDGSSQLQLCPVAAPNFLSPRLPVSHQKPCSPQLPIAPAAIGCPGSPCPISNLASPHFPSPRRRLATPAPRVPSATWQPPTSHCPGGDWLPRLPVSHQQPCSPQLPIAPAAIGCPGSPCPISNLASPNFPLPRRRLAAPASRVPSATLQPPATHATAAPGFLCYVAVPVGNGAWEAGAGGIWEAGGGQVAAPNFPCPVRPRLSIPRLTVSHRQYCRLRLPMPQPPPASCALLPSTTSRVLSPPPASRFS
ncbi:hypothetical protein EYF80_063000 [Liparis tanakae]|uniref:Uncharacterized protein n=1 Tax=Liparis tanakae TaxID=230148 RepID=A0A4Z2EDP0_9TELE|nr:hypothetical protein EYF80_063000 [Liparis tanakae]